MPILPPVRLALRMYDCSNVISAAPRLAHRTKTSTLVWTVQYCSCYLTAMISRLSPTRSYACWSPRMSTHRSCSAEYRRTVLVVCSFFSDSHSSNPFRTWNYTVFDIQGIRIHVVWDVLMTWWICVCCADLCAHFRVAEMLWISPENAVSKRKENLASRYRRVIVTINLVTEWPKYLYPRTFWSKYHIVLISVRTHHFIN